MKKLIEIIQKPMDARTHKETLTLMAVGFIVALILQNLILNF